VGWWQSRTRTDRMKERVTDRRELGNAKGERTMHKVRGFECFVPRAGIKSGPVTMGRKEPQGGEWQRQWKRVDGWWHREHEEER
jgi:hypothetical protein